MVNNVISLIQEFLVTTLYYFSLKEDNCNLKHNLVNLTSMKEYYAKIPNTAEYDIKNV